VNQIRIKIDFRNLGLMAKLMGIVN
jgi:hypothetical protein